MSGRVKGKIALITGGAQTAALLAKEGATVLVSDILSEPGRAILPPMLGPDTASREAALAAITQGIPFWKMGTAKDVAYAILYLGSDESQYVTGTELTLDGGLLAGSASAPQQHVSS